MPYYPHLFEPLQVGKVRFKNRIWKAPTGLGLKYISPEGFPNSKMVAHFRNIAIGGPAVVTTGEAPVDWNYGKTRAHCMNIIEDKAIPYFTELADAIHQFGAKASLEIQHGGQWALPELIGGKNPIGPSAKVLPTGVVVDEMNEEQMDQIADNYAKAVAFAKCSAFDMVLIHGAHGWCLGQFLSPLDNKRTDKYGGNLENRARFPKMVLERIRETVGSDFILEYRISGSECTKGGLKIDEAVEFVKMIQDKINLIHVSTGTRIDLKTRTIMHPDIFLPHGPNVYLAEAMKKAGVKIPVITVGGITDPDKAEQILEEGKADVVAMARSFIADPNWANKARTGKADEIRPCIKCFNCLDEKNGRDSLGNISTFLNTIVTRYACSVNAAVGQEHLPIPPSRESKKVFIIGGGPAGMEAAVVATERGHKVTLFEKTDSLGGQLKYADYVSFKSDLKNFKDYLVRRVFDSGIEVRLNIEATPENLKQGNPDAVIAAIGAEPIIPDIPGINYPFVILATEVFKNIQRVGKKVTVIGGGQTGCETGLHLAFENREVVIVDMLDHLAIDAGFTYRNPLIEKLDKNVKSITGVRCTKITDRGIEILNQDNKNEEIEADTVIVAVGMTPKLVKSELFQYTAPEIFLIGDCEQTGNVKLAIRAGHNVGIQL